MDQLIEDAVDAPPFALSEIARPLHLFDDMTIQQNMSASTIFSASPESRLKVKFSFTGKEDMTASHASSSPPGLVESAMSEGSSSVTEGSGVQEQGYSYHMGASSNFLMGSLPTITSGIGNSSYLPNSQHAFAHHEVPPERIHPAEKAEASGTFSQLMLAADVGEDVPLRKSRMPAVPENACMEDSCALSGALISAAPVQTSSPTRRESNNHWLPAVMTRSPRTGLEEPLIDSSVPNDEPILAASPSPSALARARTSVQSFIEDDQTFEVSMEVPGPCTMQDVMTILGNPELLRMWCDPIQSLVVTSASDRSGDSGMQQRDDRREYEAEWIEATTTALESPPCHAGYIYSAGQAVADALGFTSYGRITMFVERRRGQVGLTIGPFSGGINASHTIRVLNDGDRVRIVDRVHLTRDTEGASVSSLFLCGVLDSCLLSSCLMPSLKAYMEQVATSMARLRILVESGELSTEAEIISAP